MEKEQSWIGVQAFGDDAGDLITVAYKAHLDALKFMQGAIQEVRGVGLLEGPQGSGKTTAAQRLADRLPRDVAMAFVDGTKIRPQALLSQVLDQFGYDTGIESVDGLLKMINMFATQQTRAGQAPVIIIDNADSMYPAALKILATLAALTSQDQFLLRIILTGRETLSSLIANQNMRSVAERSVGSFVLKPLSLREALLYLHARLGACGVNNADTVFPVDVCDRLYQQSGGWPGLLNRYAVEAIERAKEFPVRASDTYPVDESDDAELPQESDIAIPVLDMQDSVRPESPQLIISKNGEVFADMTINDRKVMIGRSDFADVVIDDEYASKMHLVLLLYSDALVLLDLNSANGTTVNSERVQSTVLQSNDIISIGHHRIKVQNAPAISDELAQQLKLPDTIKMKHLDEMRRQRARRAEFATIAGGKLGA